MADLVQTSLMGLALANANLISVAAGEDDVYAGEELVVLLGDTVEGDLALDDNGALLWTDGPEQATQEADCRLDFFLGEYFLDLRQGIKYHRDILIKNPNQEVVRSTYQRVIKGVPGLLSPEVVYSLDTATRMLNVTWKARWIDGRPIGPLSKDVIIG